jgi:hypothetical protein
MHNDHERRLGPFRLHPHRWSTSSILGEDTQCPLVDAGQRTDGSEHANALFYFERPPFGVSHIQDSTYDPFTSYCVVPQMQYTKRRRSTLWGLGGRPQTQGWAWRLRCSVAIRVT